MSTFDEKTFKKHFKEFGYTRDKQEAAIKIIKEVQKNLENTEIDSHGFDNNYFDVYFIVPKQLKEEFDAIYLTFFAYDHPNKNIDFCVSKNKTGSSYHYNQIKEFLENNYPNELIENCGWKDKHLTMYM